MPWPDDFPRWAQMAYPVVYGRVYHRLRRIGLSHRVAADLAEEGTQFAFEKATERSVIPGFFTSHVHFVRWLVLVAYRRALESLKHKSCCA